MADILYIVIPCFNEEEVLTETTKRLTEKMRKMMESGKIADSSRILYVDDGSTDSTWHLIDRLYMDNGLVTGIKLSRNKGHQNALLAGLFEAADHADMIVSMDSDLQDDIDVLESFVDEYYNGSEIVYGVRKSRKKDSWFKRTTAVAFYKLMRAMGVEIVYNHADYRLMSRRALEALSEFEEVNLFLRGIVPQIGFKTSTVECERKERLAGESKYPLKKMISFAFEGITSFSDKPLKMATTLGIFSQIVCLAMINYSIVSKATGHAVAGWASIGASIWALGGLQLFMLGFIGEYIGKIYIETKHRPKYIIESIILDREKLEK